MVRFAERGHAETDGREQGKRRTGSAKRTERRLDRLRCTETHRNGPADAAKRTRGRGCGPRCMGTCRNGRTQTRWDLHRSSEAGGKTLGYASLYGNRQKWACGCNEADRRGPLYASLHRERGTSRDGRTRTG